MKLDEARRDLAARYWPVARAKAMRLARRFPGAAEEIAGAAALGLCRAARDYDPKRSDRPGAFLLFKVDMALVEWQQEAVRRMRRKPLRYGLEAEDVADARCDDGRPGADEAEAAIRGLRPREREVLRRHAGGETYAEIGRDLGVSETRAHQLYHDAIRHLRWGAGVAGA